MSKISFRTAVPGDTFPLMHLYQLSSEDILRDPLFLDYRALRASIESDNEIWIIAERGSESVATASLLVDPEQRLCKIQRIYCAADLDDREMLEKQMIRFMIEKTTGAADIIYSTSRCLSMSQMAQAEEAGFKVLGFFPIASQASEISGLVAYFLEGVLEEMRYAGFSLHPTVLPFYNILRRRISLPEITAGDNNLICKEAPAILPDLEVISASRFVARRFQRLRERKQLSNNFYPFQEPNTLICDPEGKIEIFAGVYPEKRFAAIIEERLEVPVHPAGLYNRVALMIRGEHIAYIEVIVDAADSAAIDLMLQAGFLPCAYFPCLKRHEETRRDFVVMGRSFENLHYMASAMTKSYGEFISEYFKLEMAMLSHRSSRFESQDGW
jgi:hypothetical protein